MRRGTGSIPLHPSGARFDVRFAIGPVNDRLRGGRLDLGQDFWDAIPTATSLTVSVGNEPPVAIAIGAMGKPLAAAKACSDDLLRGWGADPGAVARFRSGIDLTRLFSSGAYPISAIKAGEQGRTVALVTVDRDGKPSACRAVRSAASQALDRATCTILTGAVRYEPAAAGDADRRFSVVPVRWMLPR